MNLNIDDYPDEMSATWRLATQAHRSTVLLEEAARENHSLRAALLTTENRLDTVRLERDRILAFLREFLTPDQYARVYAISKGVRYE
jgi:hypothetical protein